MVEHLETARISHVSNEEVSMKKTKDVEAFIFSEIQAIQKKNGSKSGSLKKNSRLLGGQSAMDSLDVAELIVRLERQWGKDPFKQVAGTTPVRTLGDLISFYERALKKSK